MTDQLVNFIYSIGSVGNHGVVAIRSDDGSYRPQRRVFGTDAAKAHLDNSPNFGVYPLVGNKTQLLVIDIDDHGAELPFEAVVARGKAIADRLATFGMQPHLFRSGGGAGVHVWVVFENPQNAARVRLMANKVVTELGMTVGTKGLAQEQVEIFPKQDAVEGDGLGSLIALPLGRKSLAIDPVSLQVIELGQYTPPDFGSLHSADLAVAQKMEVGGKPQQTEKKSATDGNVDAELEAVCNALKHITADDFEIWAKIGLILKYEFDEKGFDIFHEWSQGAANKYMGEADCQKQWNTLKPDGRAKLGSIFHLATQAGWNGQRPSRFAEMNRRYAVLPIGTKTLVLLKKPDEHALGVFNYIGVRQLFDLYKPEKIAVDVGDGVIKPVSLAEAWFAHAAASRYTRVDYDPSCPPGDNGGWWNLWQGFTITPKVGNWERLKHHIFTNICSRDEQQYEWMLNWMALGVQKPEMVIGTTPVLRGLPGTGKGTLAHNYGALFGRHFITVTQSDQVAGRFNGHFFGRRFVFVDEGIFGGNRKDAGVLKTRITEDYVMLEQKGIDAIMVRNRAIFMVASNNYSVVPADMGDRRWMVLDVSDEHIQDQEYFGAIALEMSNGGREAMLHELLHRDITKGPNPRKILHTDARVTQILIAEAPYIKMLHSHLVEGRLPQNWLVAENTTTIQALLDELQRGYGDRHMTDMALGKLLKEFIPGIRTKPNGHFVVGWSNGEPTKRRSTEYAFPPLRQARKAFEHRMQSTVNWGNDLEDWLMEPMNTEQNAGRDGEHLP